MQKKDVTVLLVSLAILAAFILVPFLNDAFFSLTANHPFLMSFVKFAVLATFGECIALRMTAGVYNRPGFGVLPRALVWGVLGMIIRCSFVWYSTGVPLILKDLGFTLDASFPSRLLLSFSTSVLMNLTFAPFFMTVHKVTDAHIMATGGTLPGLLKPLDVAATLHNINWQSLWGFVFKKTLPLFWVPMHTITFLLPPHFQVLFAAALGIALGVILAFAALRSAAKPA